jgi:hypothetical protein
MVERSECTKALRAAHAALALSDTQVRTARPASKKKTKLPSSVPSTLLFPPLSFRHAIPFKLSVSFPKTLGLSSPPLAYLLPQVSV